MPHKNTADVSVSRRRLLAALLLLLSHTAVAAERIDLNQATADTLAANIVGIGPSKAAAIVEHREQYGPFKTVDDLLLVRGIGEATLKKNRDRLSASSP